MDVRRVILHLLSPWWEPSEAARREDRLADERSRLDERKDRLVRILADERSLRAAERKYRARRKRI